MINGDVFRRGSYKIDSCSDKNKMKTDTIKLVNVGINTDPLNLPHVNDATIVESAQSSHTKLRTRDDVQHVYITNSGPLRAIYHIGEVLGQGSFGTVLSISDKISNKDYAMKVIPKTIVPQKMKAIRSELQILKMMRHPHIIHLYRVFESSTRIYLILEKCTGELGKLFKQNKPFTEGATRKVITQLAGAVEFLHRNDIVHRDLKLENILLAVNPNDADDDLYIKVTDFSLGIVKGNYHEMLHERCGTLTYLPPEVITKGSYSHLCDIWSMGVIMYLLLWGKFPFYSAVSEQDVIHLICYEEPDYDGCNLSQSALHLLHKMLTKEPAQRITAAEVKLHAWIQGGPLDETKHRNVLEMMKIWRSDMMLPQGNDCDWLSTKLNPTGQGGGGGGATVDKDRLTQATGNHSKRQSIKIPIHNIHFDKTRRSSAKSSLATPPPPPSSSHQQHFENGRYGGGTGNGGAKMNSSSVKKNPRDAS